MNPKADTIKACFIAPKAFPLFNHGVKALFGGAEMDLHILATELAKDNKFAVSFVTADYGQRPVEEINHVRIIKSLDFKKNIFDGAIKVWRALRKAEAQIYFQEAASWGTFLVALFCKLNKRAFVYRTASLRECNGTYMKENLLAGKAFRWSLRNAACVIVQNQAGSDAILETLGIRTEVISGAHHLPPLSHQKRDTILWVARSAKVKRPELFIKLAQEMPEEHFTMVCRRATGDQDYEKLLEQAKAVRNLVFIERAEFDEIDRYFSRAKVFVCTSRAEGFPNTYIEACKHGTPILSLCVNPDDFITKYRCGLCAGDDWRRFVSGLKQMLNPGQAEEYGKNARRYAEQNHDITVIIEKYKTLFDQFGRIQFGKRGSLRRCSGPSTAP